MKKIELIDNTLDSEYKSVSNHMATASLICSIISILSFLLIPLALLLSVLGIAFGVIGMKKAKQTGIGKGLATTGFVIGISVSVTVVFVALLGLGMSLIVNSYN